MPVYNHHTPRINISQCSCINTIHPLSGGTMLQPMTQNHKTLRKATNWTFVLCSNRVVWIPCRRRNTYWHSTSIDSCRSRFVNRRALPPRCFFKLWLTQIRSPSYITHRAMWAPTAVSSTDTGASRHTRTPLQIQHDSQSLHHHKHNYKFTTSTQH